MNAREELAAAMAPDDTRDVYLRESMRLRAAQSLRTLPIVLLSLAGIYFALRGRAPQGGLWLWIVLMAAATLLRAAACQWIRLRVDAATPGQLRRHEPLLWATMLLNTMAAGSAFWLVAAHGDLTARVTITMICCFYAIGTMVNASSHFPSFAAGTLLNLGQGFCFWMGLGIPEPAQPAVALPCLAVMLLMITFGKDYSRQLRESFRMRSHNNALLAKLEEDKSLVETALEEARRASESKSHFLAAASHDLRQPLHAMTMFLSTLTFHVATPEAQRLLGRAKDAARLLEDQFNSLLDLSRFEAGVIQPERSAFRLDQMIAGAMETTRPAAAAKDLVLAQQVFPAVAHSDPVLVARVLHNLLDNAVKYTAQGAVRVQISESEDGYRVEISDTGPGIATADQGRIFDEYVQLGNPARQRGQGVGLGLAIVQRIDRLLDLRLELQSAPGKGSRFSFHLPGAFAGDVIADTGRHEAIRAFTTGQSIWVVDDDPASLEALGGQLSAWGAKVSTYASPEELLEAYRADGPRPDWLFCDDMLGDGLSGLDTALLARREFGQRDICIVTGNTDVQRQRELRDSGLLVIIKPAAPEALMAVLQDAKPLRSGG